MRKIENSLVNVFNEDTNLYQYQSETCLFQSELWAEVNSECPGTVIHRFNGFLIYKTEEFIYIPGITKNLLGKDLINLESLMINLRENFWHSKVALDFQIIETDGVSTQINSILNNFGFSASELHWIPRRRCIVDLSLGLKNIISNYYNKTYNDILRTQKKGVTIIEDWDVDYFYSLHKQSATRNKFNTLNISAFKIICKHLKINESGKLLFAYKDGLPKLSTALVWGYNKVLYYLYTGSRTDYKYLNSSSLLQHSIIEYGIQNSFKFYDLMGVRSDLGYGPTKFKLKFGSYLLKLINSYTNF